MKPNNWRTDYDWRDPEDYPVQDDKMFDIQSEEELMLPHEIKAPSKGIKSLDEGQRFAEADPIEAKIQELMAQGLSRELAEVLVKSGISEDSYEIMNKRAQGGRIGFALGGDELNKMAMDMFGKELRLLTKDEMDQLRYEWEMKKGRIEEAQGGRIGYTSGGDYKNSLSQELFNKPYDKLSVKEIEILNNYISEEVRDKYGDEPFKHADGGRIGYAYGDEDPEIVEDDLTTMEFMQDQGIPYGEQASGIDKNILIEKVVEEFIKRKGRKPRNNDEIIEFYMEEMAGGSAPQKVAYNPGDYDPILVEEYEKYKWEQQEQGLPIISIDEFMQMERFGVRAGGLPGILGV